MKTILTKIAIKNETFHLFRKKENIWRFTETFHFVGGIPINTTIKDVAKAAGVSVGTVSKVINRSGFVRDPVRERVLLAISLLNYKPNGIARSLKQAKTNLIGVILPDIEDIYLMQIMKSIEKSASTNGYKILFCTYQHGSEQEVQALQWLIEKRVDGIILYPTGSELDIEIPLSIPVVLIEKKIKNNTNFDVVRHDNTTAAFQLIHQFYQKRGPGTLLFVHNSSTNSIEINRFKGAMQAIHLLNMENSKHAFLELNPSSSLEQITQFISQMITLHKPDGVFATNSNFLACAVRAANHNGLNLSKDIEITGFGEIDPFAVFLPRITVAKEKPFEIGQIAVEVLLERISQSPRSSPQELMIKPFISASPSLCRGEV